MMFFFSGADIAAVDEEGQLPIFGAAYQGKTDMCRFLYERGAKVNVVDETADTPLFNAAFAGSLSTIKFFVEEADANLECTCERDFIRELQRSILVSRALRSDFSSADFADS
jgi:hypothetical protein